MTLNRLKCGNSAESYQEVNLLNCGMAIKIARISDYSLPNALCIRHVDIMNIAFDPRIVAFPATLARVTFNRSELSVILSVYGKLVAMGEWRDYGISHLSDVAIFSVFRHSAETPIYRIEKRPKLAERQGQYSVIAIDGRILKRGADLRNVVRVLEKLLIRSI